MEPCNSTQTTLIILAIFLTQATKAMSTLLYNSSRAFGPSHPIQRTFVAYGTPTHSILQSALSGLQVLRDKAQVVMQ